MSMMLISVRNSVDVILHGVETASRAVSANAVLILINDALQDNAHVWQQGGNVTLTFANYAYLLYITRMNQGINAIILGFVCDKNEEYLWVCQMYKAGVLF